MKIDRQLTTDSFAEMQRLALGSNFESFHEHYLLERKAGDPGLAGCDGDHEYENNVDPVPDEPWIEPVFSSELLKKVYRFFHKDYSASLYQFITTMYYDVQLSKFSNACRMDSLHSYRYCALQWASKRRVPYFAKKELVALKKKLGIKGKTPFLFSKNSIMYAIKDRKHNALIFCDGTILYRGWYFIAAVR